MTATCLPASTAPRMTPSAVPQTPPVASAPALQCVRTVSLLLSSSPPYLEIGACFVGDDGDVFAGIDRAANDAQRRAPNSAGRKRSCVTVREDGVVIVEQLAAVFGDEALGLDVFVVDRFGFDGEYLFDLADRLSFSFCILKNTGHPVEGPE